MKNAWIAALAALTLQAHAAITVTDDDGNAVTLQKPAQRIIAMAPHVTELLFAAGGGERIVGAVTYRDYRSDKRVTLPTSAAITDDNGSAALQVAYVYDDGPGKTVRSGEDWELSADRRRLRLGKDQLAVSDYQAGAGLDITLVALGSGTDNDAPVQVRMVLMRRGDQLRISRATQSPGQPWLLRHIYQFTRDQ